MSQTGPPPYKERKFGREVRGDEVPRFTQIISALDSCGEHDHLIGLDRSGRVWVQSYGPISGYVWELQKATFYVEEGT